DSAPTATVSAGSPSRVRLLLRLKHADAGQVAVAFGEIEAVADDEFIRNIEAHEVRLDRHSAALFFVEQHARAKARRLQFTEELGNKLQRFPRVEDVVD